MPFSLASLAWVLVVSGIILLTATEARAGTDPAFVCAAAKQRVAARLLKDEVICYRSVAQDGGDPASCLQTARAKLDEAFGNAEAKGGCPVANNSSAAIALIDAHAVDTLIGDDAVCAALNAKGAAKLFRAYTNCVTKKWRTAGFDQDADPSNIAGRRNGISCVRARGWEYLAKAKSAPACETAYRREQLLVAVGEAYTKLTTLAPPAACPTAAADAIAALLSERPFMSWVHCGVLRWSWNGGTYNYAFPVVRICGRECDIPVATVGVALIDNATGWNYQGEPHALDPPEAFACAATAAAWLSSNNVPCDLFTDDFE